jgi:polar amino acid transport system substrate-binding protein
MSRMNRRARIALVVAGLAVIAGCSGDVRLPAPIAAPTTEATTTTSTVAGTTTTVVDPSGCVEGSTDPTNEATRSYAPTGPLPAPGAMPANSSMAAIKTRGRLIIGVSADTLLFGARNSLSGQIEGFDVDMLKTVAAAIFGTDAAHAPIEYRVITYAQRLPELQSNDVDLVAHTMTINCMRWQSIAFSSEYFAAGQKVLVKIGSGFNSVGDLVKAQATVCAPDGSTNLDELKKPQYNGLKLITREDITDCLVAMQEGTAQAASGDDTVLAGFAKQDPSTQVVGPDFTSEPYGIGVNKDKVDLVQFVNAVIEQMRTDGEWKSLYQTWLVPTLEPTADKIPAPPAAVYGRPLP